MIITFSGVDCSGKSTQIELLRQYFISQGKTVTVFWYRPGYSNELQKTKDILKFGFRKLRKHQNNASNTHTIQPNAEIKTTPHQVPAPIWLTTALMDTATQWTLKLRYLESKFDVVICDRYVEDAKLDLRMKFPHLYWPNFVLSACEKLFPKPDCSLLLWLPYEEMLRRVDEKNEPFPDDAQTRKMRYRAYEIMADDDAYTLIDTSGTKASTQAKILQTVLG